MAFNPGKFLREVRTESAKIVWPTRKETLMTGLMVVIMTSLLAAATRGDPPAIRGGRGPCSAGGSLLNDPAPATEGAARLRRAACLSPGTEGV